MTTFVLLRGAGGMAWNWHRVDPLLAEAGHDVVAVDLPGDDPDMGLADYADLVVDDVGDRNEVALVAQSLGAFTAALVAHRLPVSSITLLNAMIPLDGEQPREWWEATGWEDAFAAASRRAGRPTTFDLDAHSTTCRPTLWPQAPTTTARRQRLPSSPHANSDPGRRCRCAPWLVPTTASSPWTFNNGWCDNGLARTST